MAENSAADAPRGAARLLDPAHLLLLRERWTRAVVEAEMLGAELTDAMTTAKRLREVSARAAESERN
jgi:hypothetical protein